MRLPVHSRDTLLQILRAEATLLQGGRRPTNRALARLTGLPEARVRELLFWRNQLTSLDRLAELGLPIVAGPTPDEPEHFAEVAIMTDQVHQLLPRLPERDAEVLRRRFGLDGRPTETLEEIGQRLGLTRERIRQIEHKALKRLSREAEPLREFVDGV